jgi:hypothetical protein
MSIEAGITDGARAFVHGLYRFLALVRYARERRSLTGSPAVH